MKIGVIPAAGKGKRISPLSSIFPKPMIPILDRPILEYVVHRMVHEFGVEQIYLIVGHMQEVIRNYFKDGRRFGVRIDYLQQSEQKGIAHAVSLTEAYIREPFLVILGDDFTLGSVKGLEDTFFKNRAYVVEAVTTEHDQEIIARTCSVVLDSENRIVSITEKPTSFLSNIRGCGLYLFDPVVFDYIRKTPISPVRREIEITHTIDIMARESRAYGSFIQGINININTPSELMFANMKLVEKLNSRRTIKMQTIYH